MVQKTKVLYSVTVNVAKMIKMICLNQVRNSIGMKSKNHQIWLLPKNIAVFGNISEVPIEHFMKYYSENIFDMITEKTNHYGEKKGSRAKQNWVTITKDEMEAFIGLIILIGFHKLPKIRNY